MRRSSAGGRPSLSAPLRVKNNGDTRPNNAANRLSGGSRPNNTANRLSGGNSKSSSGRLSGGSGFGARSSVGGRASVGMSRKTMHNKPSTSSGIPTKKRRSSGYGRNYGQEAIKDPRPVTDRTYKDASIRKLVDVLTENNYPHPINPKLLHSPQTRDFLRIFEFLYSLLANTDFKLSAGKKHDEEIPSILKNLGYPFTISKSNLAAVGSPHTWPHILAALSWLRENIQQFADLNVDSLVFPREDDEFDSNVPEKKLRFTYLEMTYLEWMGGRDEFPELQEDFIKQIKENGVSGNVERLMEMNQKLSQDLQELLEEPHDRAALMAEKCEGYMNDLAKFKRYMQELEFSNHQKEQKLKVEEEAYETLVAEQQVLQEEIRRKQAIFDSQEFTPADVQRINQGRMELQRQIESVDKDNENADAEIWQEEMKISKTQEMTNAKRSEYNKMAQMLKLIPVTAENAFGVDYEMNANFASNVDFIGTIKPALTQMKKQCSDQVHKLQDQKMMDQEGAEQIGEMGQEQQESLSMLEAKHKRLEESLGSKKDLNSQECQQLQGEAEAIQSEVEDLRMQSALTPQQARIALQEDAKRVNQKVHMRKKEKDKFSNFIMSAVNLVVLHKSAIQEHMAKQRQYVEGLLEAEKQRDMSF